MDLAESAAALAQQWRLSDMPFTDYSSAAGFGALNQGLSSLGGAIQDWQKQQKLSDLGKSLQSGNYKEAAQKAFAGGDTATGLAILKLGLQQDAANDPTLPGLLTGQPASASSSGAGSSLGKPAPVGGFDNAVNRTLGFEGGMNPSDSNGSASNFGINAAANPDVNVASLNKDQATQIYKQRYWDPLGLDNVDPRLAHVVFDTAVNAGPGKAQELMDASEGDPNKFLALRTQFHADLLKSNPEKFGPYAKAWSDRLASLRADVNAPGGGVRDSGSGDVVASDDSTAKTADLQKQQNSILAAIPKFTAAGNTGAAEALKLKYQQLGQQIKDAKEATVVPLITPEDRAKYGIPATDRGVYFLKNSVPTHIGSNADTGAGKVVPAGAVLIGPDGKEVYNNKNADASLDTDTIESLAQRVANGDTSALVGLGRGRQGAENIAAIQKRVGEIAKGFPEKEKSILQNRADQAGRMAGARTASTINARVDVFANEANSAMDLALETSRNLPRTTYTTFNKMLQAGQTETNDPALAAHQAQINAVANTYAKAINGGGIGTVSDKEHARSVLNAAQSPEAFEATIRQLKREVGVAHQSARSAAALRDQPVTGGEAQTAPDVAPPGSTSQTIGGAISGYFSPKPTAQQAPPQAIQIPPAAAAAAQQYKGAPGGLAAAVKDAQTAIANGAPRAAVIQRFQSLGFDPAALGQ